MIRDRIAITGSFLACIGVLGFIVGCTPSNQTAPPNPAGIQLSPSPQTFSSPSITLKDSLLGDSLCSMPCWLEITPGITPSDQALRILQETNLISPDSLVSGELEPGSGDAYWRWNKGAQANWVKPFIRWRNGIVDEIALFPDSPISVDEMFAKLGYPEKVGLIDVGTPENPGGYIVTLYYPTKGYELDVLIEEYDDPVLRPADDIYAIRLFEPMTLEKRIEFLGFNEDYILYLEDWKGYGPILELYVN